MKKKRNAPEKLFIEMLPEISETKLLMDVANLAVSTPRRSVLERLPVRGYQSTMVTQQRCRFNEEIIKPLLQTKNLKELAAFLSRARPLDSPIPLDLVKKQVEWLYANPESTGLAFLFATYLRSVSLISELLVNLEFSNPAVKSDKMNCLYMEQAKAMLQRIKIPPLFQPDFLTPPFLTISIKSYKLRCPTAFSVSPDTFFIGTSEGICEIPIPGDSVERIRKIPVKNEPYSIAFVDDLMFFTSPSVPLSCLTWTDRKDIRVPVVWPHSREKKWSSLYPMVSDGNRLFAIEFGSTPKVHVFDINNDTVVFICDILLKSCGKQRSSDLLPMSQRDTASIATNGVYLSAVLHSSSGVICRVFRLFDGQHVDDIDIGGDVKVNGWCFEPTRVSHCVVVSDVLIVLDDKASVPLSMVKFSENLSPIQGIGDRFQQAKASYCQILAFIACLGIGESESLPVCADGFQDLCTIESAIHQLICGDSDPMTIKTLLLLLPVSFMRPNYDLSSLVSLLGVFRTCFENPESYYLRHLIAVILVRYFDVFASASPERASTLLELVLDMEMLRGYSLKCLNRSVTFCDTCSESLLTRICEMAFSSPPISSPDALSLLENLQKFLIGNRSPLLIRYVRHFSNSVTKVMNCDKNLNVIPNTVFLAFESLLDMLSATPEHLDGFDIPEILFQVGCLEDSSQSQVSLLMKALMLSFRMIFDLIQKDTCLYKCSQTSSFENANDFYDFRGLSHNLCECLANLISKCCLTNTTHKQVQQELDRVINRIKIGELSEGLLLEKCDAISSMQPQVFTNVISFLTDNEDVEIAEVDSAPFVRFVRLLKCVPANVKDRVLAACSVFLSDLNDYLQYLLVMPMENLVEFVDFFETPSYLPAELLNFTKKTIPNVAELNVKQLKDCFGTLLSVSQQIEPFEIDSEKDPAKYVILANIALECGFPVNIDAERLFTNLILRCDYEVVHFGMLLMRRLRDDPTFEGAVEKCVRFVTNFMNGTSCVFLPESEKVAVLRICLLIVDHLRAIFNQGTLDLSRWIEKHKEDTITFLMMLSSDIDVVRPFSVCTICDDDGHETNGEILMTENAHLLVKEQKTQRKLLKKVSYEDIRVLPQHKLDINRIQELRLIKETIFAYQPSHACQSVFQYAALKYCLEFESFRQLVSPDELSVFVGSFFDKRLGHLPSLVHDFGQLFLYHMQNLPLFYFTGGNEPRPSSLSTEQKSTSSCDNIWSSHSVVNVTSCPIHSSFRARLQFSIQGCSAKLPPLRIVVYQFGCAYGASFHTPEIVVHSAQYKPFIQLVPDKHVIIISTSPSDRHLFMLEPACDMVYVGLQIAPQTLVSCQFHLDFDCDIDINTSEILIPTECDIRLEAFPFVISWSYWIGHVKSVVDGLISYFCEEMLAIMPSNEFLAEIILHRMLRSDMDPHSMDLSIHKREAQLLESIHLHYRERDNVAFFLDIIKELHRKRGELTLKSVAGIQSDVVFWANYISPRVPKDHYVLCDGVLQRPSICNPEGKTIAVFDSLDISHTVLDYIVSIRHALALIIFLAPSNKILFQAVTSLLELSKSVPIDNRITAVLEQILPNPDLEISQWLDYEASFFQWLTEQFQTFYFDNSDYIDQQCSLMFLLSHHSKCFPFTALMTKLLNSMSRPCECQEVCCDEDSCVYAFCESERVDIFLEKSKRTVAVLPNQPVILSEGFRVSSCEKLRITNFPGRLYLDRAFRAVSDWKLNWSHQLVIASEFAELTNDCFMLLPVSTVIDYPVARFCLELLKSDSFGVLRDHNLCFDLRLGKGVSSSSKIDLLSIGEHRPQCDEYLAAGLPFLIQMGETLSYTVEYKFWQDLADETTNLNRIFRLHSCYDGRISPFFLRMKCSKLISASSDLVINSIHWVDVKEETQALIIDYLNNIPPIILLYFVEWITGEWGIEAFRNSSRPFIVIRSREASDCVKANASQSSLEIGQFVQPPNIPEHIRRGIQEFLDLQYE